MKKSIEARIDAELHRRKLNNSRCYDKFKFRSMEKINRLKRREILNKSGIIVEEVIDIKAVVEESVLSLILAYVDADDIKEKGVFNVLGKNGLSADAKSINKFFRNHDKYSQKSALKKIEDASGLRIG